MKRFAPLLLAVMLVACSEPVEDLEPDAGLDPLDAVYLVPREPSDSIRFGSAPGTVAAGGTLWIDVAAFRTGAPLTVPWDSTGIGAITVVERAESAVRVAGSGTGAGRLDVAVVGDQRMTGSLAIAAAPIASLWLSTPHELQPYPTPLVWLAGVAITLQVELVDAGGDLLTDDSLVIGGDGSVAVTPGAHWDQVEIAATTEPVVLTIVAGGQRTTRVLTRVDAIDTIDGGLIPIPWASSFIACFHGFRDGAPVAGLPWDFEVDGVASAVNGNCTSVDEANHDRVVTARSIGREHSLTVRARR